MEEHQPSSLSRLPAGGGDIFSSDIFAISGRYDGVVSDAKSALCESHERLVVNHGNLWAESVVCRSG